MRAVRTPPDTVGSDAGTVVDATVLAERRARRAEIAEESLLQRAVAAEEAVAVVEQQLADALDAAQRTEEEHDALLAELRALESQLVLARQRAFAEEQVRIDVEVELAEARRELVTGGVDLRERVVVAEGRAEALEVELELALAELAEAQSQLALAAGQPAALAEAALDWPQIAAEMDAIRGAIGELRSSLSEPGAPLAERAAEERIIFERGRAALALADARERAAAAQESAVAVAAAADVIAGLTAAAERLRAQVEAQGEPAGTNDAGAAIAASPSLLRRLLDWLARS